MFRQQAPNQSGYQAYQPTGPPQYGTAQPAYPYGGQQFNPQQRPPQYGAQPVYSPRAVMQPQLQRGPYQQVPQQRGPYMQPQQQRVGFGPVFAPQQRVQSPQYAQSPQYMQQPVSVQPQYAAMPAVQTVRIEMRGSDCSSGPSVVHPGNLPLPLVGKVSMRRFTETINKCNQLLAAESVGTCNFGCLIFCCFGAMCVQSSMNGEAMTKLRQLLILENQQFYQKLRVQWAIGSDQREVKDSQGQTRTITTHHIAIQVIPDQKPQAAGSAGLIPIELAQQMAEQKAEIEKLKNRERVEQAGGAAVNINVSAGGPFQTIDFKELEISREIGSGSFGTVHIAHWRGSKVVVKKLKASLVDQSMVSDFVAEAELCEKVGRHPHVVSFIGACVKVPNLCMVSEFVANGSAEDVFLKEKKFSQPHELGRVVQVACDAASGLLHLHYEGVIHRDIASRNVLLDSQWRGKVCDFGMSRIKTSAEEDSESQTQSNVGPLKWMAPESLRMKSYSEKSDVWMFGILLWELFTRQPPYPGDTPLQAAIKVSSQRYRMKIPKFVPREVANVMRQCWQTDPKARPTMREVNAALVRYLEKIKNISVDDAAAAQADDEKADDIVGLGANQPSDADSADKHEYDVGANEEEEAPAKEESAPLLGGAS